MSYFDRLFGSGLVWWDPVRHRLILVDHEYQLWVSQGGQFVRWHVCYLCEHAGMAEDFFHPAVRGYCQKCGSFYFSHV